VKDRVWVGKASGEEAQAARFLKELEQVRPVTKNLIEAMLMDIWPHNAAIIDFGLDSQKHYEALYYGIREMEISPMALDEALGHGEKLTTLARQSKHNPHPDINFYTSWDGMYGRPRPEGALSEEAKLKRTLDSLVGPPEAAPTREKEGPEL
jgi:hypothetical protein